LKKKFLNVNHRYLISDTKDIGLKKKKPFCRLFFDSLAVAICEPVIIVKSKYSNSLVMNYFYGLIIYSSADMYMDLNKLHPTDVVSNFMMLLGCIHNGVVIRIIGLV